MSLSFSLVKQTVVMSLVVVFGFTLAWLPLNCLNLVSEMLPWIFQDPPDYIIFVFFSSHCLAMAHTAYNPIIYCWINARFRVAFRNVFAKVSCPCPCLTCPAFLKIGNASTRFSPCPVNNNINLRQHRYSNGGDSIGFSTTYNTRPTTYTTTRSHNNTITNGSTTKINSTKKKQEKQKIHHLLQKVSEEPGSNNSAPIWT